MDRNKILRRETKYRHRRVVLELLEQAAPAWEWWWDETEEENGSELYVGGRGISDHHYSTIDDDIEELNVRSRVNVEVYVDRRGDEIHWAYANAKFLSSRHALWCEYSLARPRAALHIVCPSLTDVGEEGDIVERMGALVELAHARLREKIARDVRRRVEFLKNHLDDVLEMTEVP